MTFVKQSDLSECFLVLAGVILGGCLYVSPDAFALGLIGLAIAFSIFGVSRSPLLEDGIPSSPKTQTRQLWLALAVIAMLHGAIATFIVRTTNAGGIDCFTFQRDAVKTLLQGHDPYGTTQANIYGPEEASRFYSPGMVVDGRVQVGLPYLPSILYWALPGYLVGDVRYSYVAAVIVSALLLFALAPGRRNLALAAFLLLSPLTYFVERYCWTEPMVLMTFSATLYGAVKKRWWMPMALGLFLSTKQYNFLALPFLGYLSQASGWKPYLQLAGSALLVAAATVVPFALWNWDGLWHNVVLFLLAQPFRQDALSFAVPFPVLLKVGPLLVLAIIAWMMRTGRDHVTMFAVGYGVSLLVFVATSKLAFRNYYFLVGNALLLAVAASPTSGAVSNWIESLRLKLARTRGNRSTSLHEV